MTTSSIYSVSARLEIYTFIGGAARFMFSLDTNLERIDELCRDLAVAIGRDYLKPDDVSRTAAFSSDGSKNWTTSVTTPTAHHAGAGTNAR